MRPPRGRRASATVALTALGATLAALAPAPADAATVTAETTISDVSMLLTAERGETNQVRVGVRGPVETPDAITITDTTAPQTAGKGCRGGGPAGSTVTCPLPTRNGFRAFNIRLYTGDGADVIDSTALPGYVLQGISVVRVRAGAGDDRITTGDSFDTIDPGKGDDALDAGSGEDEIHVAATRDGADTIDGGDGTDSVNYAARERSIAIDLTGGADDGAPGERDELIGLEEVVGGSGEDLIVGGPGPDDLQGGAGRDEIRGGPGSDELSGSSPDGGPDARDLLVGGAGPDVLDGDGGRDRLLGGDGADDLYGDGGSDLMVGGAEGDTLEGGGGDDVARGLAGNDRIGGDDGRDRLVGGLGNDMLRGSRDVDRLSGGPGSDLVDARYKLVGEAPSLALERSPDIVDCGSGVDRILADDSDDVTGCERTASNR